MSTEIKIFKNQELQSYNSFAVSAKADRFAKVESEDELKYLLHTHVKKEQPLLVLGGGSNILLTRNFPGFVIQNAISDINIIKENSTHAWLKAAGGTSWHKLVLYCIERNYAGIENLSLIPGSVGAAPLQNIGAYGVELKDHFISLEALNIKSRKTEIFNLQDCEFGYRDSIFKNRLKNKYIILNVTLKLDKEPAFKLSYGAVRNTLENMKIDKLSIKAVSDAIIFLRQTKLPDPRKLPNAGSFFKNPYVSPEQLVHLREKHPHIPSFPTENDLLKIPAAWLIEQCQWKGERLGKTGVYHKQAVVLANYDGASGNDILALSKKIQSDVYSKFMIELSPEVTII